MPDHHMLLKQRRVRQNNGAEAPAVVSFSESASFKAGRWHILDSTERKNRIIIAAFIVVLIILMIVSLFLGRMDISLKELCGIITSEFYPIEQFWTAQQESIILYTRIPRVLLACLVGACLSSAGATYQGIFQNPMAAPDILGASAGAAFGASIAIVNDASGEVIMLSAFFFSILTVMIVYFTSRFASGSQILGLVLAGVMISSLFSAGTSFIKLIADTDTQLPAITYWLMGSLNGTRMEDVQFAIIPMLIGLIPLIIIRWRINILTVGDAEALTMGVNVRQIRLVAIIASTLITAASVSVSGMIGWIGLVIPHLSRKMVGNDYKYLMIVSMLFGAVFLLIVDDISRSLLSTELPLGILNAFIGAPFFIYLLTRKEGIN